MDQGNDNVTPITVVAKPKSQEEIEHERREREERQAIENAAAYQQLLLMAQMVPIQAQIAQMNKLKHEAHNQPKNASLTRFEPKPIPSAPPLPPQNPYKKYQRGKSIDFSKDKEHVPNHHRSKKPRQDFIGPYKPKVGKKNEVAAHCISCEMSFSTMQDYAFHMSGHDQCSLCDYVAHRTLVKKHMESSHGHADKVPTDKIINGDSPEEIEAWIAERKKRFPTREKILAAEAEVVPQEPVKEVEGGEEGEIEVSTLSLKRKRELRVCKFFSKKGFCKRGDECTFLHVGSPELSMPACLINVTTFNNRILRKLQHQSRIRYEKLFWKLASTWWARIFYNEHTYL